MDWIQLVTLILSIVAISATNIGLFLWARSEARSDYRHLETTSKEDLRRLENATSAMLQAIREDIKQFHEEMKGFNCRICRIEEKK